MEQLKQFNIIVRYFSEKGKRVNNDDKIYVVDINQDHLLLLADGMGGYHDGEAAADLAVNTIGKFFQESSNAILNMDSLFAETHKAINEQLNGAGTTIGGAYLSNDGIYIFWAGDVRVYFSDGGETKLVTKDHNLAQLMKDTKVFIGANEIERYRNTVTRGLGGNGNSYHPEVIKLDSKQNFKGLICSDGVHSLFTDSEIFELLATQKNEDIISTLQQRSITGADNCSAILFSNA